MDEPVILERKMARKIFSRYYFLKQKSQISSDQRLRKSFHTPVVPDVFSHRWIDMGAQILSQTFLQQSFVKNTLGHIEKAF